MLYTDPSPRRRAHVRTDTDTKRDKKHPAGSEHDRGGGFLSSAGGKRRVTVVETRRKPGPKSGLEMAQMGIG